MAVDELNAKPWYSKRGTTEGPPGEKAMFMPVGDEQNKQLIESNDSPADVVPLWNPTAQPLTLSPQSPQSRTAFPVSAMNFEFSYQLYVVAQTLEAPTEYAGIARANWSFHYNGPVATENRNASRFEQPEPTPVPGAAITPPEGWARSLGGAGPQIDLPIAWQEAQKQRWC